tara:strand:- start:1211 stop:1480 length:270 start_codon:yes stop_codon:yes gene_type:complete
MKRLFTSLKGLKGIDNLPLEARQKLDEHIRQKAVDRTEEKILLSSKKQEDFSEEEKQRLISHYETEILQEYKSGGMKLVLAALGLGYFI